MYYETINASYSLVQSILTLALLILSLTSFPSYIEPTLNVLLPLEIDKKVKINFLLVRKLMSALKIPLKKSQISFKIPKGRMKIYPEIEG